ncbi:MAG TPA: tetratricopeptide repeat protein, partial [Roseiflexaceae bacterium]|nr:tetratricopeptide repeat protein [Roseiflexaceae bacterium]
SEGLKRHLHERGLLLLPDNFEQVVDAAVVVADLLKAAHTFKVLVTSRSRLHLSGEYEIGIPPLSVPVAQHLLTLDLLRQYAAVTLFVERACAIVPSFQLTDMNAGTVAEICRRLDGLPLAIELAAARIKIFAPDTLLTRLEHRLPLLTGGSRDLPARQQTLRATIEWSEQLLDMQEQSLFARLGVFVGGWTLEAAEAVCDPAGELGVAIIDGLQSLLDQSLLWQVKQLDGVPRFRGLEAIREYALERLQSSDVEIVIRQRHAEYYLTLAEALYSNLRGALQSVAVEHDNLRAALRWATEQPEPALALRLVDALGWFWMHAGYWSEAQVWLSWVLAQPIATGRTLVRAGALIIQGQVFDRQGAAVAAQTSLEEGLALFRELNGDKTSIMYALNSLGVMLREQGDLSRAGELFQEMIALGHSAAEPGYVAWGQVSLAVVAVCREDTAQARTLIAESLRQFRAEQNSAGIAWALNTLGQVEQLQGEYSRAAELQSECLQLFKEVHLEGMVWALEGLGQAALAQGKLTEASMHFVEGLHSSRDLGFMHGVAWCLAGLGSVAARERQPERAARLWGAAEALRKATGTRPASASRAIYEQAVASVSAQLGPSTLAACWAEGGAMTVDQAIVEVSGEPT